MRSSGSNTPSSMRCSASAKPPAAGGRRSSAISAKRIRAVAEIAIPACRRSTAGTRTDAVVKALAAIYRTGQRFGAAHVIDVLVGKETEKVLRFDHEKQPVFGAGKDIDPKTWQSILRQLTASGLVQVDHERAWRAGRWASRRAPCSRANAASFCARTGRRNRAAVRRALERNAGLNEADSAVFEALRAERSRWARLQGLPPYVVFQDTTLRAMATARPRTSRRDGRIARRRPGQARTLWRGLPQGARRHRLIHRSNCAGRISWQSPSSMSAAAIAASAMCPRPAALAFRCSISTAPAARQRCSRPSPNRQSDLRHGVAGWPLARRDQRTRGCQ